MCLKHLMEKKWAIWIAILIGMSLCVMLAVFLTLGMLGSSSSDELPPYRLTGEVIPLRYRLNILTDLDDFSFSGNVDIEIECKIATRVIKLHAKDLTGPDKDVFLKKTSDEKEVKISSIKVDSDNDFIVIQLPENLEAGSKYSLHLTFNGNLSDGLAGYYRSSYIDKTTNSTKWLAVTQFEPTDARRAFPCFDEPVMKAKFKIRLAHKDNLTAISNMPRTSIQPHESKRSWIWSEFEESVPMSTYLVAFMVSEFLYEESAPEPNNVTFRTWARKEAIDQVDFAKSYGPKFLNFFEDFFEAEYPLPKQDMVAIPDFSAGAMENWGMITYRESMILADDKTTSESSKYTIANTIAHELAHQWFGNLVTMKWWTDLWLNEGFATYAASLAVDNQFPEWNAYNYEVVANLFEVFSLDALKSSHPVSVPIKHPDEVSQIFDSISYSKGSLILHMMNSFLGDKAFQNGVSAYISKFSYNNSEQDDLWASLTDAAKPLGVLPDNTSVKDIMDTWTLQTGFPVVQVKRHGGNLTVSQKRFLAIKPKDDEEVKGCWWIPLTYFSPKDKSLNTTRKALWLSCKEKELSFNTGIEENDWIVLNHKATGVYRVNYDAHTWGLLVSLLHSEDFTQLDVLNRLTLVSDAMALAQVGELDYKMAFKILKYIRKEKAFTPWRAASSAIGDIKTLLWRTEKYDQFKKLVKSMLSEIYKEFSDFEQTPTKFESLKHKLMILGLACSYDMEDCNTKAAQLFTAWMTSETNPIPKDLRQLVYCQGVKQGGEKEWNHVWEKYLTSNVANERSQFLKSLACSEEESLLNRFLDMSLNSSSGIRRQDAASVFLNVAHHSSLGFQLALKFFEENVQKIYDTLVPNTQELGSWYLETLTLKMIYPKEVEKMRQFVKRHEKLFEKAQLSVQQGFENAESNLVWMREFYPNISAALAD